MEEVKRKLCSLLTERGIEELCCAKDVRKLYLEAKKRDTLRSGKELFIYF